MKDSTFFLGFSLAFLVVMVYLIWQDSMLSAAIAVILSLICFSTFVVLSNIEVKNELRNIR